MLNSHILKEKKWPYYVLFAFTFLILSSTLLYAVVSDMGHDELIKIQNLLVEKRVPTLALLGICLIFFLLFVFVQIIFLSFVLYLIAKFLFSIETTFPVFFRIVLKCSVLFAISMLTHMLFSTLLPFEQWLLALNPFLLGCFILLSVQIRKHLGVSVQKALLFSSSIYIIYISIQIIQRG